MYRNMDEYVAARIPDNIVWENLYNDGIGMAENIDNLYDLHWTTEEIKAAALLFTDGFEQAMKLFLSSVVSDFFVVGHNQYQQDGERIEQTTHTGPPVWADVLHFNAACPF